MDPFTQFEHDGWQRVADRYDSVWSSSTRQFIPPLLDAAEVSPGISVLDVGCGPGHVSAASADRALHLRSRTKGQRPHCWVTRAPESRDTAPIQSAIEAAVQPYAKYHGYAIPK